MKSTIVKRSIAIGGHRTSISLDDRFWKALKETASDRDVTLSSDRRDPCRSRKRQLVVCDSAIRARLLSRSDSQSSG
jgi:predicted DNA-binding ribbon-helix-helix protein